MNDQKTRSKFPFQPGKDYFEYIFVGRFPKFPKNMGNNTSNYGYLLGS